MNKIGKLIEKEIQSIDEQIKLLRAELDEYRRLVLQLETKELELDVEKAYYLDNLDKYKS